MFNIPLTDILLQMGEIIILAVAGGATIYIVAVVGALIYKVIMDIPKEI